MTGADALVAHRGIYLQYWSNLRSIIDMSYDTADLLDIQQNVAVSYD
jgi:hypothetical protein